MVMLKSEELSNPNSCLNKAEDDELVFVILGRDPAARMTILSWARERIFLGLNKIGDAKILEALAIGNAMEDRRCRPADGRPPT
jgi:hypothetical protein